MSHFSSDAQIDRIGHGLVDRTLPKAEWTHAGHFAAAFWLLRHPDWCAERDMPDLVRHYNEATGVANTDSGGYHETITAASLRAARAWLRATSGEPLYESLNGLLASPLGRSSWLLDYWSRETLFSTSARRGWVEPDLQPLPF